MARTRGHVIVKRDDKFHKLYLAYNANHEWMMPLLAKSPGDCAVSTLHCRTGISQFDESGYACEYHDHNKLDALSHENQVFDTLEAAFDSCVLENIYVFDGVVWSHHTLPQVVTPERLAEIRPVKKRRNVWREMRKAHEAQVGGEPTELPPE